MKNTKRITAVLLLLVCVMGFIGCAVKTQVNDIPNSDKSILEGRYLSGNNEDIIVIENEGPVVMHFSFDAKEVMKELSDGDRIKITCGLIAESYPGSTEVFSLELIEKGSIEDIDSDTISQLRDMGHIK